MHKKAISFIYLIFFIAYYSIAAATELQISLQKRESDQGVMFNGLTNLPKGTKLWIQLEGQGYHSNHEAVVGNGKYSSNLFTRSGAPLKGKFRITVLSHFNKSWQKSGDLLVELAQFTSPLIKQNNHGDRLIEAVSEITLGTTLTTSGSEKAARVVQREANQKNEAKQYLVAALGFLKHGKNMENLRNHSSMSQCMKMMRELQPKLKTLRARAEALPKSGDIIFLLTGIIHLQMCTTCANNAIEQCRLADEYLRDIDL